MNRFLAHLSSEVAGRASYLVIPLRGKPGLSGGVQEDKVRSCSVTAILDIKVSQLGCQSPEAFPASQQAFTQLQNPAAPPCEH